MKNQLLGLLFVCFSLISCDKNMSAVEKYLKDTLKDPESLVIYSESSVFENAGVALLKVDYGAKNSFGGMVRKTYYFKIIDGVVQDAKEESIYKLEEQTKHDEEVRSVKQRNEKKEDYISRPN